ncbi:V-type ATP synthase subunit E [Halorhabdus sp. BNX81]|uniref:V-type ATP synthase subunit E n=1 Tax=Halorhabdus sp. BNX81 TaxID=2980181 RepID=UPI0023DCEC61|nr:V-type ATP synthase subunit E [Halorhabdus sp. BNX81]WEL20268.1 Archaeal/vacuolar-type H -ATPase subunit E [Halorhabdus sp. BNX81]
MSLETVVEDIREQARSRAREITEAADEQAESIVSEAEDDAESIVAEREREVERQIAQERERRLSSANLEAKQERLNARREVLETVRSQVEDGLATLEADRRETLTRELLENALAEFEGSEVRVYGRPEDAELLESILADYDATLAGERDCLGGVVVESDESRVRVNNTFDSVLEDVWEDQIKAISDRLFEDTDVDGDLADDAETTEQ